MEDGLEGTPWRRREEGETEARGSISPLPFQGGRRPSFRSSLSSSTTSRGRERPSLSFNTIQSLLVSEGAELGEGASDTIETQSEFFWGARCSSATFRELSLVDDRGGGQELDWMVGKGSG